jgi:hypothetical protein
MNYGLAEAPNADTSSSSYAIAAASNSQTQLLELGLDTTSVGITVKPGRGDFSSEFFSLQDASALFLWAQSQPNVAQLSILSLDSKRFEDREHSVMDYAVTFSPFK